MGWFRRDRSQEAATQPRPGVPVDMKRYEEEVGEGTRPGLPHDGRYWVAMFDVYDDEARLMWEKPATHEEAKGYLKTLATYCGRKPEKVSTVHVDDVSGAWACQPRGKPICALSISPSAAIGATRRVREIVHATGLDASYPQESLEPNHWVFSQPKVPLKQYAAALFLGVLGVSEYREPGVVAEELGLNRGALPSQQQYDRWVERVLQDREQLKERTAAIEEIRPDADELLPVHMKAIVYFRVMYTIANLLAEGLRQNALGNHSASRSHLEEASSWEDLRLQARAELVDALYDLRARHGSLFAALGLREEMIEDLLQ